MATPQSQRVAVELLGKEHEFSCPEGQEKALVGAAQHLHELLEVKSQQAKQEQQHDSLIDKLSQHLDP